MSQRRRGCLVALLLLAEGCAYVVNPDVTGPHGEHLREIQCNYLEECLDFARKTCGGNYDIATQSTAGDGVLTITMMVHCKASEAGAGLPDAGR
jgi:hypothetical protein